MNKQKLLLIPMITALLIILVLITPPLSIAGVPFSLQPLFIAIIALLFDWKTTLSIIALYILIGFLGLPVFTGGKNGIATFASGTSGFIFGFIPFALLLSLANLKKDFKSVFMRVLWIAAVSLLALLSLYACGFLSLNLAFHWSIIKFSTTMSLFFVGDLLKLIIAFSLTTSLKPLVDQLI